MVAMQSRMARAALGWGVRDLAKVAAVSADTVARLERGDMLAPRTLEAIRQAFQGCGVKFIDEGAQGLGVMIVPGNHDISR